MREYSNILVLQRDEKVIDVLKSLPTFKVGNEDDVQNSKNNQNMCVVHTDYDLEKIEFMLKNNQNLHLRNIVVLRSQDSLSYFMNILFDYVIVSNDTYTRFKDIYQFMIPDEKWKEIENNLKDKSYIIVDLYGNADSNFDQKISEFLL